MDKIDPNWTVYYYTWNDFEKDINILVPKLRACGKKFTGIYGVPCGGNILATKLHYIFNLPIIFGGMDENTLIVDDISDGMKGGATLLPFRHRNLTIATLFYHPKSQVEPNIWLRKKDVDYIYFPWEDSPFPIQQSLPSP